MKLEFPTKGIAVISIIAAEFSLKQCGKLLDMTPKQVSVLAAATRRRNHVPTPISESTISKIEAIVGKRSFGARPAKHGHIGHNIEIDLPD